MADESQTRPGVEPRALIGTSAWSKKEWHNTFFEGIPHSGELAFISKRLWTVEINATFHGFQPSSSFVKWRETVPEGFVFSVKASKAITHQQRLRGAEREIAAFLAGSLLLREKLGPFLWQLPPDFAFDAELIDGFLASLPRSVDEARSFIAKHGGAVDSELAAVPDRPLRHSMEVRNASFQHPRYPELLRRHGVAAVLTNPRSGPIIDAVTADFVYARISDELERFPEGQTEEDLERHAARIRAWLDGSDPGNGAGRDVFFYFDDADYYVETRANTDRQPFDAIRLQRLVGGAPPAADMTVQTALW